ncbi:MAG: glycerol-3-phosphate 1-O-acyltransferase PlsB [Granulosicoccaceae bacterium]
MHHALHKLLEGRLAHGLIPWVKPEVLPAEPQTLIDPALPVIYVLEVGGLADRTALAQICKHYGLPMPSAELSYGEQTENSSVIVLKKRRGGVFRKHRNVLSKRLNRIIEAGSLKGAGELQVVPVSIYWGRAPGKEASFWRLLFTENWQFGGRTRKFFTTVFHGRHTLLQFSEPLSLRTLLDDSNSSEQLQRKLSRVLRVHFRNRRVASLGPDQSHRRMLISHVVTDQQVKNIIQDESQGTEVGIRRQQNKANAYAYEIAADVSYPTIRILHRLLTRLWTQLYDGVQLDGLSRLKSIADGREVIYVPCHRSHIDYLLLSYILYDNGFSLPHIAAGKNLNLPIVGGILRRGGAFFLRRTFAGNKLYAAVFNSYLKDLLQRGHSLEYFIEGGRSRTGRLLPPKGGMLAMTVQAYLSNPKTPVVFVPVYFGYERLLEGRAFISELGGGKKQKESFFALIRSLKTLREDYGKVYVNFAEPIALEQLLNKHQADWRDQPLSDERPAFMKPLVTELGDNIMQHINQAASVTPISLLATALLATPRGKLGKPELIRQIQVYHQILSNTHEGTHIIVPEIIPESAIEHGKKLGFIEVQQNQLGELISIKERQSAAMTYFRNNIQHLLVIPALIASCFNNSVTRSKQELLRMVTYAYPYLRAELFLPEENPEHELDRALLVLSNCRLLQQSSDTYSRSMAGTPEAVSLIRLAESMAPTLERYFLTVVLLARAPSSGITAIDLAGQIEACAERLALTHGREANELHDKHLFNTFIQTLTEQEALWVADGLLIANPILLESETDPRVFMGEQMRHAVLNATLAFEAPDSILASQRGIGSS